MFPEPFWQDMTYLLGAMTLVEAVVILTLSVGYLVADRERGQREGGGAGRASGRARSGG
jgi:hypothetical protein